MLVRQVQAYEIQGHHLRKVRRGSHALARSSRAHGPHRTRGPGCPYLVPEVAAEPYRHAAGHDAQGYRARPVLRELHRYRTGPDLAEGAPASVGRGIY